MPNKPIENLHPIRLVWNLYNALTLNRPVKYWTSIFDQIFDSISTIQLRIFHLIQFLFQDLHLVLLFERWFDLRIHLPTKHCCYQRAVALESSGIEISRPFTFCRNAFWLLLSNTMNNFRLSDWPKSSLSFIISSNDKLPSGNSQLPSDEDDIPTYIITNESVLVLKRRINWDFTLLWVGWFWVGWMIYLIIQPKAFWLSSCAQ